MLAKLYEWLRILSFNGIFILLYTDLYFYLLLNLSFFFSSWSAIIFEVTIQDKTLGNCEMSMSTNIISSMCQRRSSQV